MGGKITIDSATLMNKGLELMEAHHLFGTPYDQIDVVVHPQSIIHALVQLCDGSTKAHMGYPDMRVAIGYALHHPDRADLPIEPLDLSSSAGWTSRRPTSSAFPCLRLAREAAVAGGTAPCALNAANEVAVHAFLTGRLAFTGIPAVIERRAGASSARHRVHDFEALYVTDSEARALAGELIEGVHARELGARVPRLRRARDPARGGPLLRRQGRRHARRALRAVLPAADRASQARRDRVRRSARSRSAAT